MISARSRRSRTVSVGMASIAAPLLAVEHRRLAGVTTCSGGAPRRPGWTARLGRRSAESETSRTAAGFERVTALQRPPTRIGFQTVFHDVSSVSLHRTTGPPQPTPVGSADELGRSAWILLMILGFMVVVAGRLSWSSHS